MATFDSAYLLSLFNRYAGRVSSGDSMTDAVKYQRLSEAQNAVIADIAARTPYVLYPTAAYGSFPTMTTSDNQVFTFGTDSNGYPKFPIGKTMIYPSLSAIPDYPWQPGFDYLDEGTQIRIPNNRTYVGTLYYRGIIQPVDIDATHQPALNPEASRELIVWRAVAEYAKEPGITGAKADIMNTAETQYGRAFSRWMLVWKTQFAGGGAITPITTSVVGPAWVGGWGTSP